MPQETNLNVAPYFDDFDPQSNYYKVLFKPGYPVQARELTTLQSILQNQIEDVGNHLFKEGAQVIPGGVTYLNPFYAIQIETEFLGIPVSVYLDQLVGKTITGETSGITAKVVTYITDEQSERGNYTIYVDYFDSSTTDLATAQFLDNEVLLTDESITFATTFITAGEGFARTISTNAAATASAFAINDGVYFLRGYFVDVASDLVILDQYGDTPSYRIGLNVAESIINADIDQSLTDNAQGFNNYSAPGADRLKINATLFKKSTDDLNDQSFVQLAEVKNGVLRDIVEKTDYNLLGQELARRTFDESGHYYVKEFLTTVRESLNNGYGNRGVYNSNQTTDAGNTPSDDLAIYKVSPGRAYVKGYEVKKRSTTFLDVPKPRTTKLVEGQAVNFGFGPTVTVNRVYGSATIGFNTTNTLSLRDQRVGSDQEAQAGNEIGLARIYDFALESGSYNTVTSDLNEWDLSLYDVQTYTDLTVNQSVSLTTPVFIQGQSSGASAFLRYDVSAGTALTAYDVQGSFFIGERLLFNGTTTDARSVSDITNHELSNVKSVYGIVGSATTFTADLIQEPSAVIGIASISAASGGVSTITTPSTAFPGIVTTGDIVQYSVPTNSIPSFARVTQVNTNSLNIAAVTTVSNYRDGDLPTAATNVTDLAVVESKYQSSRGSGNSASNNTLFSRFPKNNIESVDLTGASLVIRKQFDTTITSNSTATLSAGTNEVFLPFDEERYVVIRSDGTTENLSSDKFEFNSGSTTLVINGLGTNDSDTKVIATLRKSNVTAKSKKKYVANSLIVNNSSVSASGTGSTTLNDGLTYGTYAFGTRVQDPVISLNVPDVIKIHGIFESNDTSDPVAPSMTTGSLDGPSATTNDLVIGEEIVGSLSGARATYVTRVNDTNIRFVYKNNTVFQNGEVVKFETSGVSAVANSINIGSKNITGNYTLQNGQKNTIYDISRIVRKPNADAPSRKVIVYFDNGYYETADTGDITIVNSYTDFDYGTEIASINGVRNTDIIDARPRVSEYTVIAGARSPFEFSGRVFTSGQHSSKNILASDESISIGYNYYLPRVDRIYIDKDNKFTVKYGTPSDTPQLPEEVNGALNIANVYLPAYLYNVSDARVDFVEHKRYQMSDIAKLEQRIKNLEYYTQLNQIESDTLNLFVPDANGLNRFKSGVFVDNFSSTEPQDAGAGVRNSVDTKKRVLRPAHYTTAVNLEIGNTTIAGVGTTTAANQDSRFADVLGTNIKRTNQVVTLDYDEVEWLNQPFATRSESVTPFLVTFYQGSIALDPTVDVWIDVNRMEVRDVLQEGSFNAVADAMRVETIDEVDGLRQGVSPVIWQSWETTGVDVSFSLGMNASANGTSVNVGVNGNVGVNLSQQRRGVQNTVTEVIDTESLGDRIVNRNIIHFMRTRNIEFTATRMKPYTRVYSFFDNVDVNNFVLSKLVEIEMVSGTFTVGETVEGRMSDTQDQIDSSTRPAITCRVATANHKYGPYNAPEDVFDSNPYDRNNTLPATYSETSEILNIDTFSLSQEAFPEFSGYIAAGMKLRGQSSGAEATVTNVRLVTDRVGTLIGSYRVPDPTNTANPLFETGRNTFRLTSSPIDTVIQGEVTTEAEETFYSQGDIDNTQEVTLSLRNARVAVDEFVQTRTIGDSASAGASASATIQIPAPRPAPRRDPLAQTFFIDDDTGIYITSVDIYFSQKDDVLPVTVQLRDVQLGTPTLNILPYSEVEVSAASITTSSDATVPTRVTFESPVYLAGDREYALVLLSDSTEYRVWISRLGEADVRTIATEAGQVLVSSQNLLGSLFKSQNAAVWTPSQYEDLKFTLYRADFVSQGSVQFFNPKLPQDLERISTNAISLIPRNIKVGLGTTLQDSGLEFGNTISQEGTDATGSLVGYGGSATGTLSVTTAGIGYTPSAGYFNFTGVALTSITGSGLNATASISISNGVALAATITDGGKGYAVGDVLTPIQVGGQTLGTGMRLTVGETYGNNELIIEEVQGRFSTTAGQYLKYTNSSGITTTLNFSVGGDVIPQDPIRVTSDGLHLKVFQRNHGMHSNTNTVTLRGVQSDVTPSSLNAAYNNAATGSISIASTTNFGTFENVSVASTNPGYAKIGNEIISYTGVGAGTLTGITRGVDNTLTENHSSSDLVYNYELDGVSLRRINATHNLNEVTVSNPITLDSYHIKIDMSDTTQGIDRSVGNSGGFQELHFNSAKTAGGPNAKATYNLPFDQILPNIRVTTPTGVTINSSVRTVTGSSINGSEGSFVDKGFSNVSLNQENYFDAPRIVASQINEDTYLTTLPAHKSFTMNFNLGSIDSRLSPAIDLNNSAVIFTSNRTNKPVTDYANSLAVNTITDDPNRFIYVTKKIDLENPATSLQVILDGYVSTYNDVRLFYSLNQDTGVDESIFVPFPGYSNLDSNGIVINTANNNGDSDLFTPKSDNYQGSPSLNLFREYKFTADKLPPFTTFRIKLIGTSVNSAIVPQFRNLRVLALA